MPREKAARLNELPEELLCPLLVGGACWIAQRSTKVADELLDVLRRTQLIAAGSPSQSSGHPYQQGPIEHWIDPLTERGDPGVRRITLVLQSNPSKAPSGAEQ